MERTFNIENMEQNLEQENTIPPKETFNNSDNTNVQDSEGGETNILSPSPQPEYVDVIGSGDLLKKIIKQGISDDRPTKDEQVVISLVGRVEGQDDIIEEVKNLEVTLGGCDVIQGVDLALALMCEGEIVELKISPRFGFGKFGLEPKVSSEARLLYIVELVAIKPVLDPEGLTPAERLEIGLRKKNRGNWWYARNENIIALHLYRKALQLLGDAGEKIGSDVEQISIQNERIKTLNNMAVAHMSMDNLDLALETLNKVLAVEPINEKATMRKGKVLYLKGQYVAAAHELKRALAINSNNKTVQNILSNVEAALVKDKVQERELYKKMLGQKEIGEKSTKETKKTNTIFVVSGLLAGLAVIGGYYCLNYNIPFNKFNTL